MDRKDKKRIQPVAVEFNSHVHSWPSSYTDSWNIIEKNVSTEYWKYAVQMSFTIH